jgi:serine/threonine-protein kinase
MQVLAETRVGAVFAGYLIEAGLGRGGMSVVYRAEHRRLKRKAALKLLAPELAEDEGFRERFLRESELAASLEHPNIVPVYDAGEADGVLFIAMRYVQGTDLKKILRREGRLEGGRALALADEVADALDAAHKHGLVHRDVKPSNVLVEWREEQEHCYLADFGLSKSVGDPVGPADSERLVGTIDYVAPEQIEGRPADRRADVYSLACMLYECLTGEVPFKRASELAVVFAHIEDDPPRASERLAELPVELDAVLARGMAKCPDDRFESAGELVAATRAALADRPSREPTALRWRLPLAIGVAAAIAFGLMLARGGGVPFARATVVRIDPASSHVSAAATLGGKPTSIVLCAGSVWVTSASGTVFELDPRSSAVDRIRVRGTPSDVADVGNLAAVVTRPPHDSVILIDAQFGQISDVVALPGPAVWAPSATALGPIVWIANPNAHQLEWLGAPYTHLGGVVELPGDARLSAVAAGAGAIWVAGHKTLWRVDPGEQRVAATIPLDFTPVEVAAGAGAVWLVDERGGAVVRVDPGSDRVVARVRVGRNPRAVAVGLGSVWVANELDGTVSRIAPASNAVVETIGVGSRPVDLAAGLGGVWVARHPT